MPRVPKHSEKRRPGRRGNFHGRRLQFLESFLPDWEKARENRTTGDFWAKVISGYWKKFDWRLQPDSDEDPSGDILADADDLPADAGNLPTDAGDLPADDNLTEEEQQKKAAVIRLVEKVRTPFL